MAWYDEDELISRAIRAYCTRQRREGYIVQQPGNGSFIDVIDGQEYVVLLNIHGLMAMYKVKKDGHIEFVHEGRWPRVRIDAHLEYVHPGMDGTYNGSCIVCLTPTDTALAFHGEAEWIIAGLLALGIPEGQAEATAHAFWSEHDPSLRKGEVPGGIMTETLRVCRDCVRSAKPSFPDPVLAVHGAPIPVVSQPAETILS